MFIFLILQTGKPGARINDMWWYDWIRKIACISQEMCFSRVLLALAQVRFRRWQRCRWRVAGVALVPRRVVGSGFLWGELPSPACPFLSGRWRRGTRGFAQLARLFSTLQVIFCNMCLFANICASCSLEQSSLLSVNRSAFLGVFPWHS